MPKKSVLGPVDVFRRFSTFFDIFSICFVFFCWGDCANPGKKKVLSVGRWVVVGPSFFRVHLFVTTRVAIKDGNFLIGATFDSDRPRHLFFRPNKSVLGPTDVVGHVSDNFRVCVRFLFGGTAQIQEAKTVFWYSRCLGRALALRAQRQPYRALYNPYRALFGPCIPFVGCPVFPLWAA